MDEHHSCKKVLLASNDGCRVIYCEAHCMAEVEIGALSLRFDEEAFASLQELFDEAVKRISVLNTTKSVQQTLMTKLRNAH